MKLLLFWLTLTSQLLLGGSMLFSAIQPQRRIWPPSGLKSFGFWWIWSLTILGLVGLVGVAIWDWNSFVFDHWSRYFFGGALFGGGAAFALWGVFSLSFRTSSGLRGDFVSDGAYHYSRHPQYFGDFGVLLGVAVVSNSALTWILSLVVIASFVIATLAEESWLIEQYGDDYCRYKRRVSRFIGWYNVSHSTADDSEH